MLIRRIAIVALALCLALIVDSAQSQRRSGQQQNDTKSVQTAQPPAPDQRGTDQIPFTVKVLPSPDSKEKAEQEERERAERAKLDAEKAIIDTKLAFETQRIADYTNWLARFTGLLFCIAVLQAGFFWWQLKEMKRAGIDTSKAANAAEASASTGKQQIELARNEFNSAHRPKIRFKHLWFTSKVWCGEPIVVELNSVNVGVGVAEIVFFNYCTVVVAAGHRLPQKPFYNEPKLSSSILGQKTASS
jgi:hypothetical protein